MICLDGNYKIEITNGNGEVSETISKNIVHTNSLSSYLVQRNFYLRAANDNVISPDAKSTSVDNYKFAYNSPPLAVYLSSDDLDPVDTENMIAGTILAHAQRDDTKSSALIGTYNKTESIIKNLYMKLVFDFPQGSANGSFSSIYMGPKKMIKEDRTCYMMAKELAKSDYIHSGTNDLTIDIMDMYTGLVTTVAHFKKTQKYIYVKKDGYTLVYQIVQPFSHTKLPATIVKDDSQHMRITYEFKIEGPLADEYKACLGIV